MPGSSLAVSVEVTVEGIEDELKENVLARMELNLRRDNPRLSAHDVQRLYKKSKQDISSALSPYGYYDSTIESSLSSAEDDFHAAYTISLGEPVRVNKVDVEIVGVGQQRLGSMVKSFPLQVGDILNHEQYELGKKKISIAAIRRGFMKAHFTTRELRIDRVEKTAEIYLTLNTGPQFVFGETTFEGGYLRPELLRRYLPYKSGDPYRPAKLIELQKHLYKTEFFSRVVVNGQVDEAIEQVVPVHVSIDIPEFLNRYSFGLGYATDTGARARVEWRNRLLNTRGHQMGASAQVSEYDNNITVHYGVPWRDPKTDSLAYNIGYYDQTWDDTDTELFSAGFSVEHKGELVRHGLSLDFRNENYTVGVTSGSGVLVMPTYTGNVIWADDLLHTKYGIDLSVSVSGASEALMSDASFIKTVFNGKTIITLLPGLRFIGRGSFGTTLVDDINDLPPSLRFYAGGDQSIRGYGYKELGTKDSSGAVVGGRYLAILSGEIEKNITEVWSLAAFWDVGNATDDLNLDFEQGVGGGVRYRLPFGQVRLDVASAITEDGAPFRLHLTVGADL